MFISIAHVSLLLSSNWGMSLYYQPEEYLVLPIFSYSRSSTGQIKT